MRKFIATLTMFLFLYSALGVDPETFGKSQLVVQQGDKSKMVDVLVVFEEDRLLLTNKKKTSEVLKTFEYKDIKSAEYSHSKHPRWKTGTALIIPLTIFALPFFFMKGKKHWLTIQTEGDYAVLKLDKKNYKFINAAFEGHSGVEVEFVDFEDE